MSNEKKNIDWQLVATLCVSIILAISGYLYTWAKDRSDTQFRAQLERTNMQLREFYGPLYALVVANQDSFNSFVEEVHPDAKRAFWSSDNYPDDNQKAAWRQWINEVTMPYYLQMESIILSRPDLLIEDEIPEPILNLSTHIAGYKPVLNAWDNNDFSRHLSFYNIPTGELRDYLEHSYKELKRKQRRLLGVIEGGPSRQF